MILHPIIDLLKRIVIALPDYAGGTSNVYQYMEITPTSDLFMGNTISIPIDVPSSDGFTVIIKNKNNVNNPPENEYTALFWSTQKPKTGTGTLVLNAILRSNGTYGTDTDSCRLNENTGVFTIGTGQYGNFRAGITYCIYVILWGNSNV